MADFQLGASMNNFLPSASSSLFKLGASAFDPLGGFLSSLFGGGDGGAGYGGQAPYVTYNPTVKQGPLSNSIVAGPVIGGAGGGGGGSGGGLLGLLGGGGGRGGAGGSAYQNIDQHNTTMVASNPPPIPGFPESPNLLGNLALSPAMPNMMPSFPQANGGMDLSAMLSTPRPIAAGGITSVAQAPISAPQSSEGGQNIIPGSPVMNNPIFSGTAAEAGGYAPSIPIPQPQSFNPLMGTPSFGPMQMNQPRVMPEVLPGGVITRGGQRVPFEQITASNSGLVPPPPPSAPSVASLDQMPDFRPGARAASEVSTPGMATEPEDMERQALSSTAAATEEGKKHIDKYNKDREQHRESLRQRREAELAPLKQAHEQAKRRKALFEALQFAQRFNPQQLYMEAQREANMAVEQRRQDLSGTQRRMNVPQHNPVLEMLKPRHMQRQDAAVQNTAILRNMIAESGEQGRMESFRDQVFNNAISRLTRDLTGEMGAAEQDIDNTRQDLKDKIQEFKDEDKQTALEDLRNLRNNLATVNLEQKVASTERQVGASIGSHRIQKEGLGLTTKRTGAYVEGSEAKRKADATKADATAKEARLKPFRLTKKDEDLTYETRGRALRDAVEAGKLTRDEANTLMSEDISKGFIERPKR